MKNEIMDIIDLVEDDVISQLKLTNLIEDNELLNVQITSDIKFIDNIWDLSKSNIKNQNKSSFMFNFEGIEYIYRNYVKTFALRNLYERRLEIPTIKSSINQIKSFLNYLKEHGVFTIELLTVYEVSDYLDTKKDLKEVSKLKIKKAIEGFIHEVEFKNSHLDFSDIYKLLAEINFKKYKYERELGKLPLIPSEVHKKIIRYALADIESDNITKVDRMAACMIIILAETGMRIMEFQNLKANALKFITIKKVKEEDFYYLEFMTYKTVNDKNGKLTYTFATNNTQLAYQTLVELLHNKGESDLDYLYCNLKREAYNEHTLREHIKRFFIRHRNELDIKGMSNSDKNCFSILKIDKNTVKAISWLTKEHIGETVYYAVPHQFRVYLATELYNQGYHLDWIRRHMNHMSTIMTEHYIRIHQEKKKKQIYVETLMRRVSKDGMLETNPDEIKEEVIKDELSVEIYKKAYDDINKFLKKAKLNIYRDLEEIINVLNKSKTPIVEFELGYCAHKGFLNLCQHQEYLSSLDDGYSVEIILPTLEEFSFTYKRFDEKSKIVDYNEKLMKKNNKYEREYLKELKAINRFIDKKVLPELEELKRELIDKGETYLKTLYPQLGNIIDNLNEVEGSVLLWKKTSDSKLNNL